MSLLDWSDPEGMYGLLVDFVADERSDETDDGERRRFLTRLLSQLSAHEDEFAALPHADQVALLRDLRESVDAEFADDPVVEHLVACREELERLGEGRPG